MWRVVAMLVLLFLLVFSMVLSQSATFLANSGAYFECAIKTFRLYEGSGPFSPYSEFLNLILIMGWIAVAYFSRLVELYSLAYRNSSENWLTWLISHGVLGPKEWAPRRRVAHGAAWKLYKGNAGGRQGWLSKNFFKFIITIDFVQEDLSNTFLWEILWLLFYVTFGLAQLFLFRSYNVPGLNIMGFGQIVLLLLLFLPVPAVAESFYGKVY